MSENQVGRHSDMKKAMACPTQTICAAIARNPSSAIEVSFFGRSRMNMRPRPAVFLRLAHRGEANEWQLPHAPSPVHDQVLSSHVARCVRAEELDRGAAFVD